MSSIVIACTLAPAVAPLCAIGVAIEMAFAQLCPGNPGMFDGNRSDTVGTFHEMSPMSSDPPPRRCSSAMGPRSSASFVASPSSFDLSSCWMPRGRQAQVTTPGNNDKRHLAGSLHWRTGRLLGQLLVEFGYLSGLTLARALAAQHGVELRPTNAAPGANESEDGPEGSASSARTNVGWRPLGRLLVENGLVSKSDLEQAVVEQRRSGGRLGEILIERGCLSGPVLARALAEQHGVDLEGPSTDGDFETVLVPAGPAAVFESATRLTTSQPAPDPRAHTICSCPYCASGRAAL